MTGEGSAIRDALNGTLAMWRAVRKEHIPDMGLAGLALGAIVTHCIFAGPLDLSQFIQ